MAKRLFVDMDGTLARFHDEVNFLERMFEKDFFRNLKPFEEMVAGIRSFIQDHPDVEVFILSSRVIGEPPYCEAEKNLWLDKYLPEIDQQHRIYTDMGHHKSEYIPGGLTKDDYLLDDYNKGLNEFLYDGGSAIKCHNNINQRGLGAYGGTAGNMWIGPMVHTTDRPELIAAELASHMGLEYDLNKVVSSYPDIVQATKGEKTFSCNKDGSFAASKKDEYNHRYTNWFQNPFNALRYLDGLDDFAERKLYPTEGETFALPEFLLGTISTNVYRDADFSSYLKADHVQFADDVQEALSNAGKAIIGQIEYLYGNGEVGEIATFYSAEEMAADIATCQANGQPINAKWNFPPTEASIDHTKQNHQTLSSTMENIAELINVHTDAGYYTPDEAEVLKKMLPDMAKEGLMELDRYAQNHYDGDTSKVPLDAENDIYDAIITKMNKQIKDTIRKETALQSLDHMIAGAAAKSDVSRSEIQRSDSFETHLK